VNLGAINKHRKIENDAQARFIAAQASRDFSETFLSSSLLRWINADELAGPALVFKLHDAVDQREQRIVFAAADIVAGFPTGATLARDDVAAEHSLAAEFLQTEPLRL
jgi:hypothetical protein